MYTSRLGRETKIKMNYEQTRNAKETDLKTYNPNKDATHFEKKVDPNDREKQGTPFEN